MDPRRFSVSKEGDEPVAEAQKADQAKVDADQTPKSAPEVPEVTAKATGFVRQHSEAYIQTQQGTQTVDGLTAVKLRSAQGLAAGEIMLPTDEAMKFATGRQVEITVRLLPKAPNANTPAKGAKPRTKRRR